MKPRTAWILGFFTIVALLLLWDWSQGDEHREQYQPESVDQVEGVLPSPADLERQPLLETPVAPLPGTETTLGLLITQEGGETVERDGNAVLSIASPAGSTTVESIEVQAGRFQLGKEQSTALAQGSISHWLLVFSGNGVGISVAQEYFSRVVDGEQRVCFTMPSLREIHVVVKDLKGDPLAGVTIDTDARTGWSQWGTSSIVTDSNGGAHFAVFSDAADVQLRASQPGYLTESVSVSRDEHQASIALRRILALCVVHSDRAVLATRMNAEMNGGYTFAIRDQDALNLIQQIQARNPVGEDESYQWDLFGELTWASTPRANIDYGGWFGGYYGSMTAKLQHLSDPDFEVLRVPSSVLKQSPELHEVQFHFGPESQFLSTPPERIQLKVIPEDPSQSLSIPFDHEGEQQFAVSPKRISRTTYRAFLPRGRFELSSVGWDWEPRMPHKDPLLLNNTRFNVESGPAPVLVEVLLHPDESFILQRFTDLFGRPLDLEAVLLPESDDLPSPMIGFMATSGRPYIERFVRPCNYSIWLYHPAKVGSIRLPDRVTWSRDKVVDGFWNVPINLSRLDPTISMR